MRKVPASEQTTHLVGVREVTADPLVSAVPKSRRSLFKWAGVLVVVMGLCAIVGGLTTFAASLAYAELNQEQVYEVVARPEPITVAAPRGEAASKIEMSSLFTPEIQFWKPLIAEWALAWEIDPNLIATLIQIESCGDPYVSSSAGAQGLFQVMPFHFDPGEDMLDVQNNARRGLNYLNGGLDRSGGHAGLALAGYNGGHSVISKGSASWFNETTRYYYWGAGIYADASANKTESPRLQEWLAAGGQGLCDRASRSQQDYQIRYQNQEEGEQS